MKNHFFKVKNETENTADLYIYGDIINNTEFKWEEADTMPDDIKRTLENVKGKTLNIYVNSGGGSVFAGMAIYNMLKRHEGHKKVYIDGLAGSIASVIALSGDEVIVPSNSFFMIHKASVMTMGNAKDLKKKADDLERIDEGILNVYQENLKEGVNIETIEEMVENETWLNGEEAAKYFNVKTTEPLQAVACTSDFYQNYKEIPERLITKEEEATNSEEEDLALQIDLL